MPRSARPWFRFYVEAVADRKLRRQKPEHRWLFVACLAAARQSPEPGVLLVGDAPMDCRDLADFAGMDVRTVRTGMAALCEAGLIVEGSWGDRAEIAYRSPTFQSRQFESDDVTSRTRKHRATRANGNLGTFQTRSTERSETVEGTPQIQKQTQTQTSEHPLRGSPPLAATSPKANHGAVAVDFEHHDRPRHDPATATHLADNVRALKAARTPRDIA